MSRTVGLGVVLIACGACTALGAAGQWGWQEYRVRQAQAEALGLRAENELLVQAKTRAIAERDEARRRAAAERENIYANDPEARAWGAAPVPGRLSERVRESARSTDAAATGRSAGER